MTEVMTAEEFRGYVERLYGGNASQVLAQVNVWLGRGDGAAIYVNHDLGHPDVGMPTIASFGSPAAQLETDEPPERLPDIGAQISWRYHLEYTYRGEQIK